MAQSVLLKYTGTKPLVSDAENSKSNTCLKIEIMGKTHANRSSVKQLAVCIDNRGYATSLERRKIYIVLRDSDAEKHDLLRIIDESGDDYLYPKKFVRAIALPQAVRKAILAAA